MNAAPEARSEPTERVPRVSRPEPPARLQLPGAALVRLRELGIYCESRVSLEKRQRGERPVLRAVESGGAAPGIGHYILFCDEQGRPLPWLQPLQSLRPNGRHAVVIAASLVSVEMFRFRNTYQMLLVRHRIREEDGRPRAERRPLFAGRDGTLPLDLTGDDAAMRGAIAPEFFTRGGERRELPVAFAGAIQAVTAAVNTLDVTQALFARAPERP